ncbi:MAG: hypothetical protein OXL97_10250 [Chloroflexota bacterium]|nr:hypothetical protein [Chloroflexota bacterium]MDE2886213.1 hypothetical protein [Chloroflexota bacterium]
MVGRDERLRPPGAPPDGGRAGALHRPAGGAPPARLSPCLRGRHRPQPPASTGLHEAVGFERFGTFEEVGYKLGAWQSVIWLVYRLGNNNYPPREPRLLPDLVGTPEWDAALAAGRALLR